MERKRRSCSGSRNGTPASKGLPIAADPDMAAAAAEEAALDASLAAAEAAAVTSQPDQVCTTISTFWIYCISHDVPDIRMMIAQERIFHPAHHVSEGSG